MFLFLLLLFHACSAPSVNPIEHKILGRSGQELYTIQTPAYWKRVDTPLTSDTMKPIAEFDGGSFKLVIHNFPGIAIPPQAQVQRWKTKNPEARITETAFNGFRGLIFEDETVFAVALETPYPKKGEKYAPVTIKVTGQFNPKEIFQAIKTFMTRDPFP